MSGVEATRARGVAWFVSLCAAALMVLGMLVAPAASATEPAPAAATAAEVSTGIVKTADLSKFQPGNIISDAVFFDRNTMSADDIQRFLESKVPSCQSGYTCLKDWYDTSRSTNADAMCGAYPGGVRERASTIIYKVAQACGINPRVILATLQKEQGLVLHTWPSEWRYTIAMGQGCPDTAACDTRYYGFFNQVFGAAWQFKRYANPPGTSQYFTWYAPGKTWNIQWSPNASCGSSPVYIQNQATANLYYYTPYQPNAASLRAGYGTGDSCSTYGNRNFYQYFTDWFGSTSGELMQLVQVSGTSERYLVSGGARWRLATAEIAAQYQWIAGLRDISRSQLDTYQDRGDAPRAVRTDSGIVYVLDSGARFRARDVYQVGDFGWDYGKLPLAGDSQVARYRDGGWLERVVSTDGVMYLIQSGGKRQVLDLGILPRFGIPALSSPLSSTMVAGYPTSTPVVSAGVYRDSSHPYRLQTEGGTYVVPDAASGTPIARSARALTDESFAKLPATKYMPVRMLSGGRAYVMLEDSWLEVSAADYPATLGFTEMPSGSVAGLPSSGKVTGPHFVRERSSSQVYLVSWGTLQAVTASDMAWVTARYGVSSKVWIALDGVLSDATAAEGLVRTESGAAYLLDGTRAYRMRDCGQVTDWGANCTTLPVVTDAKIGGYADAGTLQYLVRTPAGTTWLVQGGALRQVLDPGILSIYGIPSTTSAVSSATIAKLPVGEPALGPGVYTDGASARVVVTRGGEFTLTAAQSVGAIEASARALTSQSFAKITVDGAMPTRLVSEGRAFVMTREGWLEVSSAMYGGDTLFTQLGSLTYEGLPLAGKEQGPHFVRDDADGQEYLVSWGAAQPVSGATERAQITAAYGVPSKVWPVVAGALAGVKINHDLIVKDAAGTAWLVDGTTRFRMSGCDAVASFGKDCATLRILSAPLLGRLTDGGSLAPLLRSTEGYRWLIQSGTRREVPDPRVLSVYGIGSASTPVSAQLLSRIRLGAPVAAPGGYDDRAGDARVITGDGRVFALTAAARIGSIPGALWAISPESIDLLTAEGDLPTRITTGAASYVLTSEGWLSVKAADYGSLSFASIGARANEGLPAAGTETRPHFVREQSSAQVYLASGGLGAVADDAARAWISANYGVPPKVWVVPDGTLR